MENSLLGFTPTFKEEANGKVLTLQKEKLEIRDIIRHQVEMLIVNEISGIIPFNLIEKDGRIEFNYFLADFISLGDYIRSHKLKEAEFLAVLEKIVEVLINCPKYYLDESSFIFDERFIFINTKTMDIKLIYLPIQSGQNFRRTLRALFINLIIYHSNVEDENCLLQKILGLLKGGDFTLESFATNLHNLKHNVIYISHNLSNEENGYPGFKTVTPALTEKKGKLSKKKYKTESKDNRLTIILLAILGLVLGYFAFSIKGITGLSLDLNLLIGGGIIALAALFLLFTQNTRNDNEFK